MNSDAIRLALAYIREAMLQKHMSSGHAAKLTIRSEGTLSVDVDKACLFSGTDEACAEFLTSSEDIQPVMVRKCVCGHLVSAHKSDAARTVCTGTDEIGHGVTSRCLCNRCRPVLPWPDSDGLWWFDYRFTKELVQAVKHETGFAILRIGQQMLYTRVYIGDDNMKGFTKVIEPNPFETEE